MQRFIRLVVILAGLAPHVAGAQTVPEHLHDCMEAASSNAEFEECLVLARVGAAHGFVPVTYTLTPGHSVALSVAGASIINQGTTTHFQWGFLGPSIRFLPTRHTEIGSGRPETRRHFVDFFVWAPESPRRPGVWELTWHLFEIDGNDLIAIPVEPLLRITAALPPSASQIVDGMASVQVNDAGLVEWRSGRCADVRLAVIPPPKIVRAP
jgi:hypothetical protein